MRVVEALEALVPLLPGVFLCLPVGVWRGSCAGIGIARGDRSLRQRRSPRRERAKRAVADGCIRV